MAAGPAEDRSFFGHPRGLATLAFTETFVAFSYYGMQSLLVLYLTHHLLTPERISGIWGIGPFRAALAVLYGDRDGQALASSIVGVYSALAFGTPLLGGVLADRVLGRTRTIALGTVLLTLGHFFMTFEALLLPALLCLVLGMGCAGAMKAQLADLYAQGDLRRGDAFQIYLISVNVSVILAPLICGALGENVGWAWGFGSAGVVMLGGLVTYLTRLDTLPREPARTGPARPAAPRMNAAEWKSALMLIFLLPVLGLVLCANQEIFNAYMIWGEQSYDLVLLGHKIPTPSLVSFDAVISTASLFAAVAFWRWWQRRAKEPEEIDKMVVSALIIAAAPLILAAGSHQLEQHGGRLGLGWALGFHLVNSIGFANFYAIGLALFARVAPRAVSATLVAGYSLHIFFANLVAGELGGRLASMGGVNFWLLHSAIIAAGALILIIAARFGRSILVPAATPAAATAA